MADPVSLGASIIAIGGAAATAFKISRSLYRTSKQIRRAKEIIESFANEIGTYGSVIATAHIALKPYTNIPISTKSAVFKYLGNHNVVAEVLSQSKLVILHLKQIMSWIQSLKRKSRIGAIIKWLWRRGEIENVKPKMESIKASLHILVSVVTLDAVEKGNKTEVMRHKMCVSTDHAKDLC